MILFSNKGQLQTIYSAQTFVFIKLPQPIIFKTEFHAQLKIVFLDILDGLSLSIDRSIFHMNMFYLKKSSLQYIFLKRILKFKTIFTDSDYPFGIFKLFISYVKMGLNI